MVPYAIFSPQSFIPFLNLIALDGGIVAIVFGAIGIAKKSGGKAVTALVLGISSTLMDNGLGMRATSNSISDFHILSSIERKSVHGKRLIVHQKRMYPCVFSKESVKNDH